MTTPQIVSIKSCTAAQILNSRDVPLASGTLQLLEHPAPKAGLTSTIMTLEIGEATFPLTKYTVFYTHLTSPRVYVFSPTLEDVSLGAGMYVKILLPEDVQVEGSEAEQARKSFEKALTKHGLLQGGPVAVANESLASMGDVAENLSSGVRDGATTTISAIRDGVAFVLQHDAGLKAVELANKSGGLIMVTPTVGATENVTADSKEGSGEADEKHRPEATGKDAVSKKEVGVEYTRH